MAVGARPGHGGQPHHQPAAAAPCSSRSPRWWWPARRGDAPWARAFRLYLVARRGDRGDPGGVPGRASAAAHGGHVLLHLPEIPLPDWAAGHPAARAGLRASTLLGGLYDGLRLATMLICLGAANALANPKRLLRPCPARCTRSAPRWWSRCRRAPAAGGERAAGPPGAGGCAAAASAACGRLRGIAMPVLDDALDRSLRARRRHGLPRLRPPAGGAGERPAGDRRARARRAAAASASASTALLDGTAPRAGWALPMLVAGVCRRRGRAGRWPGGGSRRTPLPPRPVAAGRRLAGGRAAGVAAAAVLVLAATVRPRQPLPVAVPADAGRRCRWLAPLASLVGLLPASAPPAARRVAGRRPARREVAA